MLGKDPFFVKKKEKKYLTLPNRTPITLKQIPLWNNNMSFSYSFTIPCNRFKSIYCIYCEE